MSGVCIEIAMGEQILDKLVVQGVGEVNGITQVVLVELLCALSTSTK